MLGCMLPIIRSIASLILGLVIFFGLFFLLVMNNVRDNFLTANFYNDSLSENNVYDRIYDEVLLDPAYEDKTSELLGDIDVAHGDIIALTREIISPSYLQQEVGQAVIGTIDYINKDTDEPDIYIHLGPPIDNIKPALFGYLDERIDGMADVPVETMDELQTELEGLYRTLEQGKIPTQVPFVEDRDILVDNYIDDTIAKLIPVKVSTQQEFKGEVQDVFEELAGGELPVTIPDIAAIPVSDRLAAYDDALAFLRRSGTVPEDTLKRLEKPAVEREIKNELRKADVQGALEVASPELTAPVLDQFVDDAYDLAFETLEQSDFPREALDGLSQQEDGIKEHLGEGRIKEAMKLGVRGVAEPLIDRTIAKFREGLDNEDRIDLIFEAAENNNQSKEDFLDSNVDPARNVIAFTGVGVGLALVMVVLGVIFMGAVHIPHMASSLRWPGVTLLLSGLVFLVGGLASKAAFKDPLDPSSERISDLPPSMITIINDVFDTLASDVAGGIIRLSVIILVIGLVMIVGSFFIRKLGIPFLSR